MKLSKKEIKRKDGQYTVIVRPQEKGGYLVAVVKIIGEEGELLGKPYQEVVENKEQIPVAKDEVVRWISKMGIQSDMSFSSRRRNVRKKTARQK